MPTRRKLLQLGIIAPVAGALAAPANQSPPAATPDGGECISLNGSWFFRLDPENAGESRGWHQSAQTAESWRTVSVPHTWQIEPEHAEYMGAGWYRRTFEAPRAWEDRAVRVEFEAVFHSATVWLNGMEVGRHVGKGYTAFVLDLGPRLRVGADNTLVVQADNSFNESMLPRGRSSDWAHDGGIYRPVNLLVSPTVFIERIWLECEPDLTSGNATAEVSAIVRNVSAAAWEGRIGFQAAEDAAALIVSAQGAAAIRLGPGERKTVSFPRSDIQHAKLWHFDHPHLYCLTVALSNGHACETTFGIRKIEARNNGFYLNGERVRLMGAERMAGSNPEFGMAEPAAWIAHDHADLKELNCVYTRVHWQQDRRVLDWCDRHGILIQTEVPTWGGATFENMGAEPSPDIMNNGLEQLREMIDRDRNHPSIFSWGVCNEINGQNPPAYGFAKRMYEEAKRQDPRRLVTYASNSLQKNPEKDVAGLMDYVMWNEYYETWYGGTAADVARNLDEIHRAFPDKAIVISEYGYCACTAERPEGDARRIEVLRAHDQVFREREYVAGLIFFDYNDYRTHVGDRGTGVMKQRVHGVVDLYGAKKPSWEVLRRESSPIESVHIAGTPAALSLTVTARNAVPAYRLLGYEIRGIAYGFGQTPVERAAAPLETIGPGESANVELRFTQPGISHVQVDVMRPTGFSAWMETWQW
jgi:beta-galactosidase